MCVYLPHLLLARLHVLPNILEDTLNGDEGCMIQMESEWFDKKPTDTSSKTTIKTFPSQQRLNQNPIPLAYELEEQLSDYD